MAVYKVIDVSDWQGKIDWEKVKKDGVVGAIIRYADGTTLDARFDENMKNARAAGIYVGCYIFSRAKTTLDAQKEAIRLFNASKKYNPEMPLYIDLEAKGLENYADTVAAAFLEKMKELGGWGGVYSYLNWWNNYLKKTAKNYHDHPFWIAQYYSKMEYKPASYMGMWQYTSSGKVNGISGRVDMDKCYVAYWEKTTPQITPVAPENISRADVINNMKAYCTKMAADNRYHYKKWDNAAPGTKKCPICTNAIDIYDALGKVKTVKLKSKGTEVKTAQRFLNYWMGSKLDVDGICGAATVAAIKKFQKHYGLTADGIFGAKSVAKARALILGWNCIGFAMSVWHNGGGLPIKCNCGVISNEIGEKIAKAKTDAEAIKIVQDKMDFNDVTVIRNSGKNVPQTKWQAGDIGLMFDGNTYKHMFFIMGDGKIADSSGRGGDGHNDIAIRSDDNYTARVLIRWTGGKKEEPKPAPAPTKKKYDGEFPSTELKKTRAQVIEDAIIFAKWIAGDNTFHYGHGKEAHHNGCYFCGTQPKSKKNAGIVDWEHTFCCNPFVGACWAHGGCIPTALKLCRKGTSWDFNKGKGYDKSSLFENLGHPAKSKLEAGDVLCNDKHVALYIGGGKIAEASGGDDNKKGSSSWNKSIHVTILTDDRYKGFKRVHRLKAGMSATMSISHGEVSDRVKLLQAFLKWYGYDVTVDRIFGDKTLVAVKKFQKAAGVTADGIVGPKTIAAMKKAVK